MSRFNVTNTGTKTTNIAGGEAFSQTPELELVSILLTSFAQDQYYKKADDTFATLINLVNKCDPKFVAQAAVYARTEFGMRSITHLVASELGKHAAGKEWATRFYDKIIHRPDDITEIMAYHKAKGEKYPAAMKRGFAAAIGRFDNYQLAKYRGETKGLKLVDAVNVLHPVPTENNAHALKALINGTLISSDTLETKLTQAGQKATTEEEKLELKKEAWTSLITERKIGYFALLRNLRNIMNQAPEVLPQALTMLTDANLIKKSLVLPFRFTTAYDEIKQVHHTKTMDVMVALSIALDNSLVNVPRFDGETCIMLDKSGSMQGRPAEIASLFAAILLKTNTCDFIEFSDNASYRTFNPLDTTVTIASAIKYASGGTNFKAAFNILRKKYDRIIILSDMQAWMGYHTPAAEFTNYKGKFNADPKIYSFDLAGYGRMQFPERNVYALAGFSDKVFDIMKLLEQDKNALVNTIKQVVI